MQAKGVPVTYVYSGTEAVRLRQRRRAARLLRRVPVVALLAACALGVGACSTTYQLGGLFERDQGPANTGSVAAAPAPTAAAITESDLAAAKAVVARLFSFGRKDLALPWENPSTGARGTVTPLASAYTQGGHTCHDFLASYIKGAAESWFQGGACRIKSGRWEVREMKPLQRS